MMLCLCPHCQAWYHSMYHPVPYAPYVPYGYPPPAPREPNHFFSNPRRLLLLILLIIVLFWFIGGVRF